MSETIPAGFVPVPVWWVTHPQINSNRLSVLMALARYADSQTHTCFPSQSTIADLLKVSRSFVNRIIAELCEIGLISKRYRRKENKGTTSCMYHLRFDDSTSVSSEETPPVVDSDTNQNKDNKPLSACGSLKIEEWEPLPETIAQMACDESSFSPLAYAKRFKEKVIIHGYSYANPDAALLRWFREDRDKGLLARKGRQQRKKDKAPCPAATMEDQLCSLPDEARNLLTGNSDPGTSDEARLAAALFSVGKRVGANTYMSWLKGISLRKVQNGCLTIQASSGFAGRYVVENFGEEICAHARRMGLDAGKIIHG